MSADPITSTNTRNEQWLQWAIKYRIHAAASETLGVGALLHHLDRLLQLCDLGVRVPDRVVSSNVKHPSKVSISKITVECHTPQPCA